MPTTLQTRITSIDALRGLTVAFMILVNDPGDWAHVYGPLEHARWNGFTPTDLVFPNFLFLVGCSIVFSVQSRLARDVPKSKIALQMFRRAFYIFAIKMFLTAFPHFHLTRLRIFGVLTRIALCYLIAGLIFLVLSSKPHLPETPCPIHRASASRDEWDPTQTLNQAPWLSLSLLTAAILLAYWLLMRFVPVPGLGHPVRDFPLLDPNNNLAAYIDRAFNAASQRFLHTGTLYEKTRDPEGILSTLPSVATTLLGILAALWLRRETDSNRPRRIHTCTGLLLAALLFLALGRLWNPWFPINKNLWTSSYVLFSAGWSLLLLALFFWLFDSAPNPNTSPPRSRLARALLWPLLVFGSNAITAFAVSNLVVELLTWWKIPRPDAPPITAWRWLYSHLFASRGSTSNTSLAFAIAVVAICFLPNWFLWRRKLFLRV